MVHRVVCFAALLVGFVTGAEDFEMDIEESCALLQVESARTWLAKEVPDLDSAGAPSTLFVPSFAKYPGYSGGLSVEGQMMIESTGGSETTAAQVLQWSFTGLDTACTAGAGANIENACGIHIHEGTSCDSHENVGGHLHSSSLSSDPWQLMRYVSFDGVSYGHDVKVITGLSSGDIIGHVMIVHELESGGRIACGVIGTETGAGKPLEVTSFVTYPGYTGSLRVAGAITIEGTSGTSTTAEQVLTWTLTGLDPMCLAHAADGVKNGCGIHVHMGTSCESDDAVGGHHHSSALNDDPWLPVVYVAAADGYSHRDGVRVVTGTSNAEITGRVMIVHELAEGGRIACGVIRPKAQ